MNETVDLTESEQQCLSRLYRAREPGLSLRPP